MVSEYLDFEGLYQYDINIKKYIDKKIKGLVAALNIPTDPNSGEIDKNSSATDVVTEAEIVDQNRWNTVQNENGGTDVKYNDTIIMSIPSGNNSDDIQIEDTSNTEQYSDVF